MRTSRWMVAGVCAALLVVLALTATHSGSVQAQGDPTKPGLIVFATNRLGNYDIFTLDPETGLSTQLTNDPGDDIEPQWSADGKLIVFASNRDGDFELFTMGADGTNVKQITLNFAEDRQPRWQPNGKFVTYGSDVNGQWDLYTISVDNGLVRQLTNDAFDERGPGAASGDQVVQPSVPTPTTAPTLPDATVESQQLNVRQNPGTGAAILITIPKDTPLDIIARRSDNTWVQAVTPTGVTGWVSADLLTINVNLTTIPVLDAPIILPPPTATPIPSTATPGTVPVTISFTVDRTTIHAGECVNFTWFVEGISAVYYQGIGVVGSGTAHECPAATTTYNLRVVLLSGVVDNRYITITVNP